MNARDASGRAAIASGPRRGDSRLVIGRIELDYSAASPRIMVAGAPVSISDRDPRRGAKAFAMPAGADQLLIADRDRRMAILAARAWTPADQGPAVWCVAAPDPRDPTRFRLTMERPAGGADVLYLAQAYGHTTGCVPAIHDALATGSPSTRLVVAIRRPEDAEHARRKVAGNGATMHVVPFEYDDVATATIQPIDVQNVARPALFNRELALAWISANAALARAASAATLLVNDCRPEAWMLHQLATGARGRVVPIHAFRYAFSELQAVRRLVRARRPSRERARVGALLQIAGPAFQTRRQLCETLRASGLDPRRRPSVDFEGLSRAMMDAVPERGTIWYQAVHWRELVRLEQGPRPYVAIPPLGLPCGCSPEEAAAQANAFLAGQSPEVGPLFDPADPRGVVLVSQGNGFSASSRRHWSAMLRLAAGEPDTHFLFAGGSADDARWLAAAHARARARHRALNVTVLGWVDAAWRVLLRALRAKARAVLVCRPGLSSIGSALVNGVAPLLMTPDPIGAIVDPATAEVAVERAVYPVQFDRLYATRDPLHRRHPLPIVIDTLRADLDAARRDLQRALDPEVQRRIRAAVDGACRWDRVTRVVGRVIALESATGPMPIRAKRALRDAELAVAPLPQPG